MLSVRKFAGLTLPLAPRIHVGTMGKSFTRCCLYDMIRRPVWLPCKSIIIFFTIILIAYVTNSVAAVSAEFLSLVLLNDFDLT